MPELKRLGDITYDKESESIAVVHLAYSTRQIMTYTEGRPVEKELVSDHEGNTTVDKNKLAEHLNKFLVPEIEEKIQHFYHHILECSVSATGTMTLKVERRDHDKVVLNGHHLNFDLTSYMDGAIRLVNSKLARLAEEKAAAAKSTPASTGLFSASAAKAFHAEIAEAVAKAQQTAPRAKL